jgi:hypothetical protein
VRATSAAPDTAATKAAVDAPPAPFELAELIPAVVSNSRANEQMQAGSDESKSQSVLLSLNRKELEALAKFTHEATCQGEIQLRATPTGIGTTLRVTCSQNCGPDMDITDYFVW